MATAIGGKKAADGAAAIDGTPRPPAAAGRERVLGEGRALFTAQGFAAVSMQQIADAAGVNKATLYHHFRDKEDLFVAIMGDEFAAAHARIETALGGGGTLREKLHRVAALVFASNQSDFGRLAADLRGHVSAARRAELLARCAPPWESIRPVVERAGAAGEIRAIDPDLAARLFFGMVVSQVWWAKLDDDWPAPDARVATAIVDVLLDGIGAGTTSAAAAGTAPD